MAHFHSNALIGAGGQGGAEFEIERSLRFNDGDSPSLSRTVSQAGNRRTYTFSFWVKRSELGRDDLYKQGSDPYTMFLFRSDDVFGFDSHNGSLDFDVRTEGKFRDLGAWMHIVLAVDTTQATNSNRVKLYVNGVQQTLTPQSSGWPDQNYDTFINATSPSNAVLGNNCNGYLAEFQHIDGQQLAASSFGEYDSNNVWQPKQYSGSYGTNGFYLKFADNSSNAALGTDSSGNDNTWTVNNLTAVARNYTSEGSTSGSFYDSAGGAASKMFDGDASTGAFSQTGTATFTFGGSTIVASTSLQVRAFKGDASGANVLVNGTDISSLLNAQSSGGYSTVNITSTLGGAPITLANVSMVNVSNGSGNIAQIFVDGVELVDASDSDIDSLIDSPMNYEADSGNNGGNYCTWNPLSTNSAPTFSNGSLTVTNTGSGAGGWRNIASTIAVSSGKWYMEFDTVGSQAGGLMLGIQKVPEDNDQFNPASFSNNFVGMTANSFALNCFSGAKRTNSSDSGYGSGMSVNDKIMMAVDLDNGKIWWGKNGTWFASGDPDSGTNAAFTGLSGTFVFAVGISASEKIHSNFGQRPYEYSNNISGFKSVCTQNLADPTIADGSTAMNVKTWSGDSTERAITGYNHSPDFVWIKTRNGSDEHVLSDIVRGAGKVLSSSANNKESDFADPGHWGHVSSFDSDGFTVNDGAGGYHRVNLSGRTYVGWAWDAGTSTVSNSNGNVTANVRANASAGFSIISVPSIDSTNTIRTAGHGLNAAPYFIISKNRDFADHWFCYHKDVQTNNRQQLRLNTTDGTVTSGSDLWSHSSSVMGFNGALYVASGNTDDLIFYCWTPVEGFSSFGSYQGNGSADGPFVYTGFRPRWALFKESSASGELWVIYDSERNTSNVMGKQIYPSLTAAEADASADTHARVDFLSNGFKIRGSHSSTNTSGETIVYAAFAEHPLKTARAR